ncbi:MAG: 4-alpha-glucanotransferase [Pseudomonadota bacterium]
MTDAISDLAKSAGILPGYCDLSGQWRETSQETNLALLAAMGYEAENQKQARELLRSLNTSSGHSTTRNWHVVTADEVPAIPIQPEAEFQITLEDGTCVEGRGAQSLPELPGGYHEISMEGQTATLLSAPPALSNPPRGWGVITPLSGLRDTRHGGFGDYEDLRISAEALCGREAGFIGINPVHAGFPEDHDEISPYAPSHRRRLNVLHVTSTIERNSPRQTGNLIDFASLIPEKWADLRREFNNFEGDFENKLLDEFIVEGGEALAQFALHQALSAVHGPYWKDWPDALHDLHSSESKQARQALAGETRFHAWLQWQAENQLASISARLLEKGMSQGLYLDIAVGTHPWGAETWMERNQFATNASLGAPPDAFSSEGQNWGLAPFNPHALARDSFRALAETLRKQLQFAGLLRIDHILGFERAYWMPSQAGLPGAYVKMPRDAMLAVVRIEAARTNATIIGEDLGNVPDGLQEALAGSGVLGCRVMMFENRVADGGGFVQPEDYPPQTLASFSTHDLPTWLGWRRCTDIKIRQELGHIDDETAEQVTQLRSKEISAIEQLTGIDGESADGIHALLGKTRSRLAALQIEDILQVEAQPNLPGTIHEYPNWRQRLPIDASEFANDARISTAAKIMKESGR